jgi:uncharacterized protein
MRVVSLLASVLIFAASSFGQQTPASPQPSQDSAQASTTVDQSPAHPITPAQVHELLELTGANRLKDEMIHNTMAYLQRSLPPYMPKDVVDDLEASFAKMDVEAMSIKAYQKHISTEDAAQFIAFYRTPAGRRLASVLPAIAREVQVSATQQASQIAQEVVVRHKDEIEAAAAKYHQQQPDTPTITAPN